jgi:ElaA protein
VQIFDAPVHGLDPRTLYQLLALRSDVFVVEQHCAYRELDGRDLEPDARMIWAERDGVVIATLRLLIDPDGALRIGRVATTPTARSGGVATQLMERALELAEARVLSPADRPADPRSRRIVLDAQVQLEHWYERFGFARCAPPHDEDGIPHVPMARPI